MAFNRVTDFTTDHERVVAVLERYRDRHERIEALLLQYESGMAPIFAKCHACLPEFIRPRIDEIFMWPGAIVSREMPEAIAEGDNVAANRNLLFYEALLDAELASERESNALADERARRREVASTVGLNLTDNSYRRYLRAGIPYAARIPVKAAPRYVKVVVYDPASDLAGSTVERLK